MCCRTCLFGPSPAGSSFPPFTSDEVNIHSPRSTCSGQHKTTQCLLCCYRSYDTFPEPPSNHRDISREILKIHEEDIGFTPWCYNRSFLASQASVRTAPSKVSFYSPIWRVNYLIFRPSPSMPPPSGQGPVNAAIQSRYLLFFLTD
jgi:hypothetical protein